MDEDDESAALAHQQELESRRWQEELRADPAYEDWLNTFEQETRDGDHGERDWR